jgi:general nucleoside transport system permease protein
MNSIVVSILNRTIAAGTPLLLGTLGEIVAERSGVLNLGVEGMMSMGAVGGFMVAMNTGNPWLGLLAAIAAGAALSILHAFASVTLKVNQVVSGLALAMLGVGMSGLLGKPYMGRPLQAQLPSVKIPFLSEIPYLGTILFDSDPLFYFAIALGIVLWFLLSRTRWGVRVRSVGENPAAAAVQGVSVTGMRYLCTAIGGALAGMGGGYLSLVYTRSWTDGMNGGRGWIVIALTIFALWNPLRAFLGAFLFGGIFVLQYMLQPLGIPPNLLGAMPYVATLLVLVGGGLRRDRRRQNAPAALGEPFTRGER